MPKSFLLSSQEGKFCRCQFLSGCSSILKPWTVVWRLVERTGTFQFGFFQLEDPDFIDLDCGQVSNNYFTKKYTAKMGEVPGRWKVHVRILIRLADQPEPTGQLSCLYSCKIVWPMIPSSISNETTLFAANFDFDNALIDDLQSSNKK